MDKNNKINSNLIKILETIISERELVSGRKVDETELAKLQYEYFDKKKPDPKIESIKLEILNGLKGVASKMNSEFGKLQNAQACAESLDKLYADKEIERSKEQITFLDKIRKLISNIKK